MANGDTKTESYLRVAAEGTRADLPSDTCCNTKTQNLILGVANRIMDVEDEVEELKNNPDVVDIVDTYADLQAYDTQHLTNNDVIRVLNDETHNGESTYYRFTKSSSTWTYIGTTKQYTNFVGTDGQDAGEAGLVPAPATTDTDKYLKSDGTWATVSGGSSVNVVQTTGNSTTDVMSQNAVTGMVFSDVSATNRIRIGKNTVAMDDWAVAIGSGYNTGALHGARANTKGVAIGYVSSAPADSVAIGSGANAGPHTGITNYATAIGSDSSALYNGSVAIGSRSATTRAGEVNIGSAYTSLGYNNTNYRVLGGVHDGQEAHDAVTKGQLDTAIINGGTTAPTTATVGAVGTLYSAVVSNTAHLYVCTAIDDTTDPQNPSYTWTALV